MASEHAWCPRIDNLLYLDYILSTTEKSVETIHPLRCWNIDMLIRGCRFASLGHTENTDISSSNNNILSVYFRNLFLILKE